MLAQVENAAGRCGPLDVRVEAPDGALAAVSQSFLDLYSGRWDEPTRAVRIGMRRETQNIRAHGDFLACAHMTVDRAGARYIADTQYGFLARGLIGERADEWTICVPEDTHFDEPQIGDMEDLFSLICTVGWRAEGYVPIHAGAVVKDGLCAILCAASGGGKSTLTTALVLNGWSTLGDDKLLLRMEGGAPVLRSLLETFNLDPQTGRWFDLGDLASLPRYSAWTPKRRVRLDSVRPGAAVFSARPTHVVSVSRSAECGTIRSSPLTAAERSSTMLRQIVLPAERETAQWILSQTVVGSMQLKGVQIEVGHDAYAQPSWLSQFEAALR